MFTIWDKQPKGIIKESIYNPHPLREVAICGIQSTAGGGNGFETISPVADPEGGGGVRGFKPPLQRFFFFFCLSVLYENSHGPGP